MKDTSTSFLYYQFTDGDGNLRNLRFENPIAIVRAEHVTDVVAAMERVQRYVDEGYYAAGYVSYEASPAFDPAYKVTAENELPLVWFGIYEQPREGRPAQRDAASYSVTAWTPNTSIAAYNEAIAQVKEAIRNGDTYQTNYTIRLWADFEGDAFAFYERLSRAQRADYGAYLDVGTHRILSVSPELFFRKQQSLITTKPMKGTIKRGKDAAEDDALSHLLSSSAKERAENVMIVDLLRNDLSRLPNVLRVDVPHLFTVETYPTVLQMTSTVEAEVKGDVSIVDLFRALFPCGSITGAPKISTMDLIHRLEPDPREVYCGAIGYIEPNGDAVFNVAIRTVIIDATTRRAQYGVGGAITWDSTAGGEYEEVLTKAKVLTEEVLEFDLLESLRLEHGQYDLLERHIARLQSSAHYFAYALSEDDVRHALDTYAASHRTAVQKVRMLVSRDGAIRIDGIDIDAKPMEPQQITLATSPISCDDKFLYHKTTHRVVYDRHRAGVVGVYDVLLWNEEGELTEFTIGNVVMEIDGQLYTPPLSSGLLAGTFRAQLLEEGIITERVLTIDDFDRCERLWLINSVRGWVPVIKG